MKGRLRFADRAGRRTTCFFPDLAGEGNIANLASRLQSYTNAEIIEAAVQKSESIANPGGYPASDPPFDSAGTRAELTFRITDGTLGPDEPDIVKLQLYAPVRSMFELTTDGYAVKTAIGATIAAALSTASGWTMSFVSGRAINVQI
jgi:hypothetical protein